MAAASATAEAVVRALAPHVAPRRLRRLAAVLNARVGDTAVVAENVCEPHNVSALLRTADALGVQHVFVVEKWGAQPFTPSASSVDKGSAKWLTLHRFGSAAACVDALRAGGFALHATDLDRKSVV